MFVKALSVPVEKACRLLLIVVAAPVLGEVAFGRFQFADTVATLLVLATDLGLGIWTTRALARTPERAGAIVGTGLRVRSLAAVPYLLLVAVAALVLGPGDTRTALLLLGVASLAGAFVEYCNTVFRGFERLRDEARLNAVRAVLITGAGLGAVYWWRSLAALAAGVMVGSVAAGVFGLLIILRRYRFPTPPGAARSDPMVPVLPRVPALPGVPSVPMLASVPVLPLSVRAAVVEALPLWMATLLSLVYFKGDTVLLRMFSGDAAVGSYAAAFKIFEGTMILPSIVMAASFPGLVRSRDGDPRGQRRMELGLSAVLLGLGGVIGGAIYVVSAPVIGLVFGAAFSNAVPSLRVLCLAVPLLFLNYGLTHFLIARHLERRNLAFAGVMVALNVGMNLLLIPRFGGRGAAWATLGTEVALTIFCFVTLEWCSLFARRPSVPQAPTWTATRPGA